MRSESNRRFITALRTLGLLGAVGGLFLLGLAILAFVHVSGRGPEAIAFGDAAEEQPSRARLSGKSS